jgi:hypothetical protein
MSAHSESLVPGNGFALTTVCRFFREIASKRRGFRFALDPHRRRIRFSRPAFRPISFLYGADGRNRKWIQIRFGVALPLVIEAL